MTSPSGSAPPKTHISGYKQHQMQNFTPEQMELFQKLLSSVSGGSQQGLDYLSKLAGGDEGIFQQIERPAYEAFNRTSGDIAVSYTHLRAHET